MSDSPLPITDALTGTFTATPLAAPTHQTSINIHLDPHTRRCTVTVSPSRETVTVSIEGAPCLSPLDED